ncbi:MAG: FliM/FliN family flagellar motor switch protein [Planctomycetia bacterium]|nr:FliM/FliN family flagellar motor switch protein [Planctomycetia bacterium]
MKEETSVIRPLNLRSKVRFSRSRMNFLGELFTLAGEKTVSRLEALFHQPVVWEVREIRQQNWQYASAEIPAGKRDFVVIQGGASWPSAASWGVALPWNFLLALLDRLLGSASFLPSRQESCVHLTRVEEKLFRKLCLSLEMPLAEHWQELSGVSREECGKMTFSETAPWLGGEMVLILECMLAVGNTTGEVLFFLPAEVCQNWLTHYEKRFPEKSLQENVPVVVPQQEIPWQERAGHAIHPSDAVDTVAKTLVHVSVQLPGVKVTPQALAQWKLGDTIALGKDTDEPMEVLVEGISKFQATPGQYRNRKVFRII